MRLIKRMTMGLALAAGLLLLNGCLAMAIGAKKGGEIQEVVANPEHYQLVGLPYGNGEGGRIMRIDTVTGEIWSTEYNNVGGLKGWQRIEVKP